MTKIYIFHLQPKKRNNKEKMRVNSSIEHVQRYITSKQQKFIKHSKEVDETEQNVAAIQNLGKSFNSISHTTL
jgi:hypothetical protein